MSHYGYLNVKECKDVKFDDVGALNRDLEKGRYNALLELLQNEMQTEAITTGFVQVERGKVKFWDRESQSYQSRGVNIWGCLDTGHLKTIAKHMTAGKLVLEEDHEGQDSEIWVLRPGSCKKASFE